MGAAKDRENATDGGVQTAAVLVIGDEILSGRTQDANVAMIARRLAELGIDLREVRIVPDEESVIVRTLNDLRAAFTYVFTTGGIGPTHDDITADCVAKAFGVSIDVRDDARAILEANYGSARLNEARLRMARIPDGAELIENPISHAPGFRIGNVFVMAGIPIVAEAMMESLSHRIGGGPPMLSRTVSAFLTEGQVAKGLAEIQARYPDVKVGCYPSYRQGRPAVSLVMRSRDEALLSAAEADAVALVREQGAEPLSVLPVGPGETGQPG